MQKLKTLFLSGASVLLLIAAQTGISTNSTWILYEPEVPETMKK